MKQTTLVTVNKLQKELEAINSRVEVLTSRLEKIQEDQRQEIIRTEKGKAELERSKKAEELRRQGKTTDMFKAMFGQD